MADRYPAYEHMARLVGSVIEGAAWRRPPASSPTPASGADLLAGCTSMYDLIVVPRPIPRPPYDVIAVRAPGSLHEPAAGMVRITHLSVSGRNDTIDRPVAETLPLFWRFVAEKYGIRPPVG
jgi:hypothetical protein